MTRRDNPQSERRQALDAAIAALDEKRSIYSDLFRNLDAELKQKYQFKIDEINRYIRILSNMREEGPLL